MPPMVPARRPTPRRVGPPGVSSAHPARAVCCSGVCRRLVRRVPSAHPPGKRGRDAPRAPKLLRMRPFP
ncbi:hypothetical protein KCH_72990 [Kitasatospora cheerisanensis KCTC 2395]|uniref:Uncharacterized protein n=1 Tax=Kitasatospora cheerisanensis KCTC 2395 TaxID=1348663 RepID=A0A066YS79_9ACTN|nr:hypothetical protein KCH_72990 [Kitasatospora cheerisanensis KCTC 2395]